MKYWERPLKTIFKLAALPFIRKIKPGAIESVLKDSLLLLNDETCAEIRQFIRQKQTAAGGFADRAGKSDLYYSLFGYFISEALSVNESIDPLKNFVKAEISSNNLTGVHLYCGAILYSKLFEPDEISASLTKRIAQELKSNSETDGYPGPELPQYSSFMGFLALYYLEDYLTLKRLLNTYSSLAKENQKITSSAHQHINTSPHHLISTSPHQHITTSPPCPVTAASAILQSISGVTDRSAEEKLKSFHCANGGFKALPDTPCQDLLSTGVALYALKFVNSDIRLLKPHCLSFVDSLYDNGGFRATLTDFETDVEYTFYGLLALGSLK